MSSLNEASMMVPTNQFAMPIGGSTGDMYEFSADDEVQINDYMKNMLVKAKDSMDMEMWDEALDDAVTASELGVSNDRDFQIFHYIDLFVEDIAGEIFGERLSEKDEADLKKFMFGLRDEVDYSNLVTFWAAILKWLGERRKTSKAYPNRGVNGANFVQKNNVTVWAKLAYNIQKEIVKGKLEEEALYNAASLLHPEERLDFKAWYRFKFGKITNLYDVNKIIQEQSEGKMNTRKASQSKFAYVHEDQSRYYLPDFQSPYEETAVASKVQTPEDVIEKQRKLEEFNEARSKLVSRTFAIDKLLERYSESIGQDSISFIEDALNALRKKIRQLKCATIVRDTVIKTAGIVKKEGFGKEAKYLEASAYEFIGDRESLKKVAAEGLSGASGDIAQKLQQINIQLQRRDIVRDIARLDFQLHDMNASALFPELSDAQAKLIEATTYASNKLKDVIPKLRSQQQGAGEPAPGGAPPPPTGGGDEFKAPKAPKPPRPDVPKPEAAPTPTPTPTPTPAPVPAEPAPQPVKDFERQI